MSGLRFEKRRVWPASLPGLLFALVVLGFGEGKAQTSKPDVSSISAMLRSRDDAAVSRAIEHLHRLGARELINGLRSGWMATLLEEKKYDEVIDLTQRTILRAPYYTADMQFLLDSKIQALLRRGQVSKALVDAKRLYAVADMRDMEKVLRLLEECIAATYPHEPERVRRFKDEQVTGYDKVGARCSILDEIIVDPKPYSTIRIQSAANDTVRSGAGNLLLLAGMPVEARASFERAGKGMQTSRGRLQAIADLARAMKAEDGTLGRANAFLKRQLSEQVKD